MKSEVSATSFWRFIPVINAPGTVQMAIDSWLLEQHRLGKHPPTLRFYTWSPAAISLGYHQRRWPTFWNSLPLDLVRRPTGGRAVLHQGDLTYMIVTNSISGKGQEVYRVLCEFLIQGWRSLGVQLHYGTAGRAYMKNSSCFGTATVADLVSSSGNKFIGSAQLYKGQALLQHGSMILSRDRELFEQVFGSPTLYFPPLELPWSQESGALPVETIVETLTEAARGCFGVELVNQPLSDWEWQELSAFQLN